MKNPKGGKGITSIHIVVAFLNFFFILHNFISLDYQAQGQNLEVSSNISQ